MKQLLILLILVLMTIPVRTQENVRTTQSALCQIIDIPLNSDIQCDTLTDCSWSSERKNCFDTLLIDLYEQCEQLELENCSEHVTLFSIAMIGVPGEFDWLSTRMNQAISHYNNEDLSATITIFQDIIENRTSYDYYTYHIGLGILYNQSGDYELAIEQFTISINIQYNNPLAFYFRTRAYSEAGNIELASRDYHRYQSLSSSEIITTLPEFNLQFEISESEEWIAYSVRSTNFGPG